MRFAEQPQILRKLENLDRQMYLVRFDDGATTFVFPHEVVRQPRLQPLQHAFILRRRIAFEDGFPVSRE